MSVQALSWVLDDVRGLKAPERIVLIVLANYADKDNASCWPAIGTIAGCCELTPETVRRTLRKLETKGLVASEQTYRKNGAKSTNLYRLRIEAGAPPAGQGVHPTPDEGRRGAPDEGNHPLPQGGSTTLNRQSNRQLNQRAEDVPVPASLTTPAFLEKWAEWLEYRRKVKKIPVSLKAAKLQLRDCAEAGPEAARDAIETAMRSDWQGLFPNGGKGKHPTAAGMPEMVNYGWSQR